MDKSIKISDEDYKKIKEIAKKERRTQKTILNKAIEKLTPEEKQK